MPPKKATSPTRASSRRVTKSETASQESAKSVVAPKKGPGVTKKAAPKKPSAAATKAASKKPAPAAPKKTTNTTTKTTVVKKTTITKVAPVKKAAAKSNKRKLSEEEEEDEASVAQPSKKRKTTKSITPPPTEGSADNASAKRSPTPTTKKAKKASPKPRVAKPKIVVPKVEKPKPIINIAPTQILDIYVFGCNEAGELGLGDASKKTTLPRPVLNPKLSASAAGVVGMAAGGMHGAVLTKDNKILTWGVNDGGALGRDTFWEAPTKDIDADGSDDDSDDEVSVNPRENTPTQVEMDNVPEGTVFTQIVAGDSATFAVTQEGLVYGWGEIRGADGPMGFTKDVKKSPIPMLIPKLKNIVKLAAGNNHFLALDKKGAVYSWGAGEHNQLGRRIVERTRLNALVPTEFGLPKGAIVDIFAGSEHSFALHKNGKVYSWGANNMGQCGHFVYNKDGGYEEVTPRATVIKSLEGKKIKMLAGGNAHSLALTEDGEILAWGKARDGTTGLDLSKVDPEITIPDTTGKVGVITVPTALPFKGSFIACGGEHAIALGPGGKAPHYSWGFNEFRQTGIPEEGDINVATELENRNIEGKTLVWAAGGGQFSFMAGVHEETEKESS
ncbi:ran exchange factor prp20 pim1 protein [Rutstroemia sp. NJR-2017a BBW]|nr:ran exchange factor prp20 pim1 protein [Rutstroemia sp. NJR-2017a BBW]